MLFYGSFLIARAGSDSRGRGPRCISPSIGARGGRAVEEGVLDANLRPRFFLVLRPAASSRKWSDERNSAWVVPGRAWVSSVRRTPASAPVSLSLSVCKSRKSGAESTLAVPNVNDPSAGSPTETLLRLLLPLNDQVRPSFRFPCVRRSSRRNPVRGSH